MTNEKLYEVLGDINEKYVSEARVYQKAKKPIWAKWGAIAALWQFPFFPTTIVLLLRV
jgi:hypothetical protein